MIYVVGHTAIDHICTVSDLPPPNGSSTILGRTIFFGGGAANIAAGISRLGEACTLISAVGGDFPGSEYDRWQKSLGLAQQFFEVPPEHTPTAFMFTDGKGDQITFFEWGASKIFPESVAPSLPFVHLATADPDFNCRVAEEAEFCTFDPGQDLHRYSRAQLERILSHVDILFANHHEVESMSRTLGTSKEALANRVPMAVFTMGAGGSEFSRGCEKERIPALCVSMVDPTGAGDAYRAGFLAAMKKGYSPLVCCRIGTVTASFAVEVAGCQNNLPTWDLMEDRYRREYGALESPVTGEDTVHPGWR
ncbi:MAG: carbohydrate kinase family protein [Methanolinea sp.]